MKERASADLTQKDEWENIINNYVVKKTGSRAEPCIRKSSEIQENLYDFWNGQFISKYEYAQTC